MTPESEAIIREQAAEILGTLLPRLTPEQRQQVGRALARRLVSSLAGVRIPSEREQRLRQARERRSAGCALLLHNSRESTRMHTRDKLELWRPEMHHAPPAAAQRGQPPDCAEHRGR